MAKVTLKGREKTTKEAELIVETNAVRKSDNKAKTTKAISADLPIAKSGKRSQKAIIAAEKLQIKADHKIAAITDEIKPANTRHTIRSRMERHSKSFRKIVELIEPGKVYDLKTAIELIQKTNPVKFDATVELHVRLGVDPRQADQNIRDSLILPSGTGKKVRIAVFADNDDSLRAKNAGAEITDNEALIKDLEKGIMNFNVLISTPSQMQKLGKYARILGPRGLMPNLKSGTVTNDITKAVSEAKAGRVEYRVDSNGIVHLGIGKVSFSAEQLTLNFQTILNSLKANKPSGLKNLYFKTLYLATSMGPSIKLDLAITN